MTLEQFLTEQGYTDLRMIEGRGLCGIRRFIFTTGLVYGLNMAGYEGRYCYPDKLSAKNALEQWDGVDHPDDDDWIKNKGHGIDIINPKNNDTSN